MGWINSPNEVNGQYGFCFLRICSDKKNCGPYDCYFLYCNTNAE
ncbi:Protein of unknown function [Bacillus mobilis]|nr:Protein of unknown function [Bacillus mobilis]